MKKKEIHHIHEDELQRIYDAIQELESMLPLNHAVRAELAEARLKMQSAVHMNRENPADAQNKWVILVESETYFGSEIQ